MIECEARLKSWGNSVGLIIPKDKLREEKLHPKQKVRAIISPIDSVEVKDIFGDLKQWKRPTTKIMKEIDSKLGSKILKA